jgi:hypothetical protein
MGDKILILIYALTFGLMVGGWTYVAFALIR